MSTQQRQRRNGKPTSATAVHQGLMEDLTDTELSEGSKDLLRNLITKDLVLAYLNDAEVNEVKWHIRIVKELYFAVHPDQNCLVTGKDRAYINDDSTDTMTPLTENEQITVESFFLSVITRVTRARGMKQQEMLNTDIREHRDNTESNGSNGIIGRLRG